MDEPVLPFQVDTVSGMEAKMRAATVAPPRVCFLVLKAVSTPVCTLNQPFAACGKTPRDNMDTLASDRKDVTCTDCKRILEETPPGQEVQVQEAQVSPVSVPVAPGGGIIPPPPGDLTGLLARLDVGEIEGRLKALKGEEAALKVLLKAARAKSRASQELVSEE